MFERFTERAHQVVVLAQDEARALKHNYIGTEHILLGLLREEEGLAARVLESLDITVEEVRAQVARIVGQGDEVTTGQIPFTPRAKKVLELALPGQQLLLTGWLLFAAALGVGLLVGWAIWGH
jgi:ATP-dependent Clp protease ATP-binding subunit ClpC